MENFKIESSYLKLCYEFRAFITCMKADVKRPDYQNFLMCSLIKRLGLAFVSKYAAKSLKRSAEFLNHSSELLKQSAELLRVSEKTKSLAESLKSSAECLGYNTAHTVLISHSTYLIITQVTFF